MNRDEIINRLENAYRNGIRYGGDDYGGTFAAMELPLIKDTLDIIKHSELVINARWHYYTNDENKPRWRCTNCGKIIKREPNDIKRCEGCGAHMSKEA